MIIKGKLDGKRMSSLHWQTSLMNNSISSEISFNNENKIEIVLGNLK